MCELLGYSGTRNEELNPLLREFYTHSHDHPNGWGLALLDPDQRSLEKEPIPAMKSSYLKTRLTAPIRAEALMAHVRLATIGVDQYTNCHPFMDTDCSGRTWTLMHNGTIFSYRPMDLYSRIQEGTTDSERILLFLMDCIARETEKKQHPLDDKERFDVVEHVAESISAGNNKANLIIYDGDLFYVHSNCRETLHSWTRPDSIVFSSVPLKQGEWKPVPINTITAYKGSRAVFRSVPHKNEYTFNAEQFRMLFLDFSSL